jgi:hypothetical protein
MAVVKHMNKLIELNYYYCQHLSTTVVITVNNLTNAVLTVYLFITYMTTNMKIF